MKRIVSKSILLCIAVLTLTTNMKADITGWKFTWNNLAGHNLAFSTDEYVGSSITFHIINLNDNTGSIAFPLCYVSGDYGVGGKNDFAFTETQFFTIEMWQLILQSEIAPDTLKDAFNSSQSYQSFDK
jgi:hypothetical protein